MNAEAKKLSQFYTNANLSLVLANKILKSNPNKIFDLGAGEGALLEPFMEQGKYILAVDIDSNNCNRLSLKNVHVENFDSIQKNNIDKIIDKHSYFDACVINPPFRLMEVGKNEVDILNDFGLGSYIHYKKIPSEIIFLINALRLLKVGGVCAAILPDRIVTSLRWKSFREILSNRFFLEEVVSIPEKSFAKTEAVAHVLILNKKLACKKTKLSCINNDASILVSKENVVKRSDFGFYINNEVFDVLLDGKYHVYRGRLTLEDLKRTKKKYIHTNNIDFIGSINFLERENFESKCMENNKITNYKLVRRGDIVLARVGTRVIGKVNIARASGYLPSDCIIVIRSNDWVSMLKIFRVFKSGKLSRYIKENAKGVAAKYITINDLKDIGIGL